MHAKVRKINQFKTMLKKAQFDVARKTIYWMIAGVVITIVVVAFALVMANYKNKISSVPPELRAELIILRFVNNPDCFAYGGVLGSIDVDKFNNGTLFDCYHTEQEKGYHDFNFGLTLVNLNQSLRTNNFFNKVDFTLWKPVLVYHNNTVSTDTLRIYVQEKI